MITPREADILYWLANGKTYHETALILGISFGTVKTHLDFMKLRLNATNVTHTVAKAYEMGLLGLYTVTKKPDADG